MFLRRALALTLLVVASAAQGGGWQSVDAPRGFGAKWMASVTNAQGHTLRVFRKVGRAGYEAFAEVSLANGQKFGNSMPSYRIDQGKLEDTTIIKIAGDNMGLRWGYVEPERAGWRIWQNTDRVIEADTALSPWMRGSRLTLRFMDADGKSQVTEFSLTGSANAITQAFTGPFQ